MRVLWAVSAMGSGFVFCAHADRGAPSQNPAAAAIGWFAPFLLFGGGGLAILGVHVYPPVGRWCGRIVERPDRRAHRYRRMRGDGRARA